MIVGCDAPVLESVSEREQSAGIVQWSNIARTAREGDELKINKKRFVMDRVINEISLCVSSLIIINIKPRQVIPLMLFGFE